MKIEKMNKKGNGFDLINNGMLGFIGFVFIALLAILSISITKDTSLVCPSGQISDDGVCLSCPSPFVYNATTNACAETGNASNTTSINEFTGAAYNASKDFQVASNLPPQFAQIIVIVVIMVGILGMLGALGYAGYRKIRDD